MINFFRDVLDGPLYIVIAILSVIFIMAIIGFLMERKKLEEDEKAKFAVVSDKNEIPPIQPVNVEMGVEETKYEENIISNEQMPNSNIEEAKDTVEVQTPVIIFSDEEQKVE